jgi:hypothetical protein
MNFNEWWKREGSTILETSEVIARAAWIAAKMQSGNYTNSEVARTVTFANGRVVTAFKDGTLSVGWIDE